LSGLSPGEREFVERIGLFFEMLGGPRTMGRIYGWLMICDPPHQSITEIATALAVSKASISTVIRQLQAGQMVERFPMPGSRQHHYQLRSGGWTQVIRGRVDRLQLGVDAAEYGLSVIGVDRPAQRAQLAEFRDFFTFVAKEYGDEVVRRWEDYRKRHRDERSDGHDS
jgi:hypothetical protein